MTPEELVQAICTNAWRMGVHDFAAALGESPRDPNVQGRFLAWQQVATLLGSLDSRTLRVIAAPPAAPQEPPQ